MVGWLLAPTYPSGCFDGELWLLSTIYWNDSHGEAFVYMSRIKKRRLNRTCAVLVKKLQECCMPKNGGIPMIQHHQHMEGKRAENSIRVTMGLSMRAFITPGVI